MNSVGHTIAGDKANVRASAGRDNSQSGLIGVNRGSGGSKELPAWGYANEGWLVFQLCCNGSFLDHDHA